MEQQFKLIPESDSDVKTILILKMFSMGLLSESQVMETVEFPKGRGRQKRKYLKKMIEKMKKYEDLFPGHLAEMIQSTEEALREHT